MTASIGKLRHASAGKGRGGVDYLRNQIATGRHDYYTGAGEAPGRWVGRGLGTLGLVEGDVVSDRQMTALWGHLKDWRDPTWDSPEGKVLGRKPAQFAPRRDGTVPAAITGFDVTFSPAKSVSVLWALATPRVRAVVEAAHEQAVDEALGYLDVHASHARAGQGSVRKVESDGLIVGKFRHRTARSVDPKAVVGDPQLHTHCALLNRVMCVDGRWRTLDSRALYRQSAAAGAVYAARFEAMLSEQLGLSWETPGQPVLMRELSIVPRGLCTRWANRRNEILAHYRIDAGQFYLREGRTPTRVERSMMKQQITLELRQRKTKGKEIDLHSHWRSQLDGDDRLILEQLRDVGLDGTIGTNGGRLAADYPEFVTTVLDRLHAQRAHWTRPQVVAEVARLLVDPTVERIEAVTDVVLASSQMRLLTVADMAAEYTHETEISFSSTLIEQAEADLLAAAGEVVDWTVDPGAAGILGSDQFDAVTELAQNQRRLTTVVGPAGTGKTTMLGALATAYKAAGREVTVMTLAAAAADVVTSETGVPAFTIKTWQVGGVRLPRGSLIVIDEAAMVPTLTLQHLLRTARALDCRLALIGDPAQMNAPEAGGIVNELANTDSSVELDTVRRFRNEWERAASLALRMQDRAVVDVYAAHGRITATTAEEAPAAAAKRWWDATRAGEESLVIVDSNAQASDVAELCQQYMETAGMLGSEVAFSDTYHQVFHVGDLVQTRENDSSLRASDGMKVLNRHVWRITGRSETGVTMAHTRRGSTITLPIDYMADRVQLAYALTTAGAQGRTGDAGCTIVTPRTGSQALYVAMTRGRRDNHAFVVTDGHDNTEFDRTVTDPIDGFEAALTRDTRERSAAELKANWERTAPQRQRVVLEDRARMLASATWARVTATMPAEQLATLQRHHTRIIAALGDRQLTTRDLDRVAHRAVAGVDWTKPRPGDQLLELLATTDATTPTHTSKPLPEMDRPAVRSAGVER
ncbi:MAG: MobF family relaxase [Ilumatobacteraceae bacterium]